MNEFDIIETYFKPLTMGRGALDDDAAVLPIPAGQELVVSSDTLSAGTHFIETAAPAEIAHKALRVNLSDLAAMGASPLCYQLNIAFSDRPDQLWLERFTGALLEDQNAFGIYCSGGDTTSTKGALSISITVMGLVPEGGAVKRSSAQDGDAIILTGPVGDAYIGLHLLSFLSPQPGDVLPQNSKRFGQGAEAHFIEAYYKPQPRVDLTHVIREYAHAAIDISDGLVADLGHICKAADLSADIRLCGDVFSPQAQNMVREGLVTAEELLGGGDDYVLALAVAPENVDLFLAKVPGAFQIGTFSVGEPLVSIATQGGQSMSVKHTGWSHF